MVVPGATQTVAPFSSLRRRCDKDDCRQRRFVAVIECILDQNVRDRGAASFPAMNQELLQILHEHGIGILQMPCPEIAALGPERSQEFLFADEAQAPASGEEEAVG